MNAQDQVAGQAADQLLVRVVFVQTPERVKTLFSLWEKENDAARRAGIRLGRIAVCAEPAAAQLLVDADRIAALHTSLLRLPNNGGVPAAEVARAIDAQCPPAVSIVFAEGESSAEVAARVAVRRDLDLVESIVRVSCRPGQTTWYCGIQAATPSKSYITAQPIVGLCTFSDAALVIEGAVRRQDEVPADREEPLFSRLLNEVRQKEPAIWPISKEAKPVAGLKQARILLAGGKGVGSKEMFRMLEEVARRLGVGIAASRSAVEMGWIGEQYQVGQSGTTVQPELYVAFGIHGAIQHLSGMRQSQKIIAVNTDPHAPIFSVAHVGYICDVQKLIPWMLERLNEAKQPK
ncbi:MAG: electron transfer flavoprotein subunit alpha/FixB family protein [Ndongobacter sp.]|nr:electron transfer flavoprotein subunit alpha/FixB family protein [Ndongobacter sp.]